MLKYVKGAIQIASLALFVILFRSGHMQVWMKAVLAMAVSAAVFGRYYCGWICPMNTVMRFSSYLSGKAGIRKAHVPSFFKKDVVRWTIFGLFALALAGTMAKAVKFPLMVALIPVSAILSIFFVPSFWHRYLCPFGVLFSVTSRLARISVHIDPAKCSGCGACSEVCPAEAISASDDTETRVVTPSLCHECLDCSFVCPCDSITLGRLPR